MRAIIHTISFIKNTEQIKVLRSVCTSAAQHTLQRNSLTNEAHGRGGHAPN